jgi:hypothetical protein
MLNEGHEMQNAECRMQNCGTERSAGAGPDVELESLPIQHSTFRIQHLVPQGQLLLNLFLTAAMVASACGTLACSSG